VGVSIALCIGIGNATFGYVYDPPSRTCREYRKTEFDKNADRPVDRTEYYVRGEKVSQAVFDDVRSSEWRVHNQAEVAGWAAGLGTAAVIALLWTLFEWFGKRRFAPLEEQIAAIQRDHASEVHAWGGPAVLREPAAVAEILRLETPT
jgi:hypothetical protein